MAARKRVPSEKRNPQKAVSFQRVAHVHSDFRFVAQSSSTKTVDMSRRLKTRVNRRYFRVLPQNAKRSSSRMRTRIFACNAVRFRFFARGVLKPFGLTCSTRGAVPPRWCRRFRSKHQKMQTLQRPAAEITLPACPLCRKTTSRRTDFAATFVIIPAFAPLSPRQIPA